MFLFSLHLQQLLSYDMDAYIEVVLHSFVKPTCIKEYFYESEKRTEQKILGTV